MLLKQLNVIKFSLCAVNNSLTDVELNEKSIREGISNVKDYIQILKAESGKKFSILNAKIEIIGHILRFNNTLNAVHCNLDLPVNNTLNAQKRIVQPQVISPRNLVQGLIKSTLFFLPILPYLSF
jgi:hypothetical protein